jgi:hypothetical protein
MAKITVSFLRELEAMVRLEQISYSRMVEMLNEKAAEPEPIEIEPTSLILTELVEMGRRRLTKKVKNNER